MPVSGEVRVPGSVLVPVQVPGSEQVLVPVLELVQVQVLAQESVWALGSVLVLA